MRPDSAFARSWDTEWIGSERVALVTAEHRYTYDDLWRRSQAYGRALQSSGARTTALLVNQSAESAFLYLGALQTCDRVVPIGLNLLLRDPLRFAQLFERHGLFVTRSDWLLAEPRLRRLAITVTVLDPREDEDPAPLAKKAAAPEVVLHTSSSSSGQTKAVLIDTGYLPTFLDWCQRQFSLRADDKFLWAAPLHFDMTFIDFFVPLHLGAALVIPGSGDLFYPDRFSHLLHEQQVTVVHSVPSLWHGVATRPTGDADVGAALRAILVAGDILPHFFVEQLQRAFPLAALFNVYGQSEANSYLAQRIAQPDDVGFPIRLGRVDSFARVFVDTPGLSAEGVGQLVVQGTNVALGYLGSDYETVIPLSADLGPGVFPTGDLVNMHNGVVDFLGRSGARVSDEPGSAQELELRSTCNRIPGVVQSVFVQKDGRAVLVLEPYVAADGPALVAAAESIVPPHVKVCARTHFPLNYNGKIDTRLLAESLA